MTHLSKKISTVLVAIFFLLLLSTSLASSQSSTQIASNYTVQLEEYQRAHNSYVLARSNYQRFNTLAAEEQAFDATLDMLIQRDEVVMAYIEILIDRIQNSNGLEDSKIEELVILLEAENDWFEQHSSRLSSAATLDELVQESNEARDRYEDLNSLIYLSFSYLSYGRVNDYNTRLVDIYSDLRSKFESIRNEEREDYKFSDEKIITIDNWLVESQSSITRSEEKLNEVKAEIDLLEGADQRDYNTIVRDLQDSRLHMQKATSFMGEVIREIKTAE